MRGGAHDDAMPAATARGQRGHARSSLGRAESELVRRPGVRPYLPSVPARISLPALAARTNESLARVAGA